MRKACGIALGLLLASAAPAQAEYVEGGWDIETYDSFCSADTSYESSGTSLHFVLRAAGDGWMSVQNDGWDFALEDDGRPVEAIYIFDGADSVAWSRKGQVRSRSHEIVNALSTEEIDAVLSALAASATVELWVNGNIESRYGLKNGGGAASALKACASAVRARL